MQQNEYDSKTNGIDTGLWNYNKSLKKIQFCLVKMTDILGCVVVVDAYICVM